MVTLAPTNPDLQHLAERMGVRLQRHTGGVKGWYSDSLRVISTRRGLTIAEYRTTLAHELGHAHHRDTPRDGHYSARQEARAWRYAADLLLTEHEVRDALLWHDHHRSPAAYDLEVTRHLLDFWLSIYERNTPCPI